MSTSDNHILIPANQLKAGMFLDLEGDPFASMTRPGAGAQEQEDNVATLEALKYEYAIVESTEAEGTDCLVIHCEQIAFACPPYHNLTVATDAWADEDGEVWDGRTREQFIAAFDIHNTATNN